MKAFFTSALLGIFLAISTSGCGGCFSCLGSWAALYSPITAHRSSPPIYPPFKERQFGATPLIFRGIHLSLPATVYVLILAPEDKRSAGSGSLETMFYRPPDTFGRSGQPEEISAWLHQQLVKAVATIPGVQVVTPETYKEVKVADLALRATVHRANVTFSNFSDKYSATVDLEISCMNTAKQAVKGSPFTFSATHKKDVPSRVHVTPISPVLDQCFEKALQSLIQHEHFLLALRHVARMQQP